MPNHGIARHLDHGRNRWDRWDGARLEGSRALDDRNRTIRGLWLFERAKLFGGFIAMMALAVLTRDESDVTSVEGD